MKVLLTCGGTGGHIYPAIAIADAVKEHHPDAEILFIGTKKGMENKLVPAAGYEIKGIDASGFNRRDLLKNVNTLKNVLKGGREAAEIIKEFAPDVAIGTGGYVTGTVILQSHFAHIPCYIHEQNAAVGLTNKILDDITEKTFISFADSASQFHHPKKCVLTGNPVRADFEKLSREECRSKLGLKNETMILIFGGSLGAEVINEAALRLVDESAEKNVKLYFITGNRYYKSICERLDGKEYPNLVLMSYADNMPELMCASDIVVSRAGAIAVSELMVCGRAAVLIPSPNVTNNHQYHNAKAVADAGAAVLLEEKTLLENPDALSRIISELAENTEKRSEMSKNAAALGSPDAAEKIIKGIGLI